MKNSSKNVQGEYEFPVYRRLQEVMEDEKGVFIEDVCEQLLQKEGICTKFLPSEVDDEYPFVVKKVNGEYSIGIPSRKKSCKIHYCVQAFYLLTKDKLNPGFLHEYLKDKTILSEKPHILEILKMEYLFTRMK